MATNLKGPGIFLAQFAGDTAPFDSWSSITRWAAGLGFKGVQIPAWDARMIDLARAAESKTYCDELHGVARENGVEITELGTHLQGQLVAVHPAYDEAFDAFAPEQVRRNPKARQAWAVQQMLLSAKASKNLGLKSNVSFPGALAWPYLYPWPQRPAGLV
ncbi:MAG: sugar phosphate isomerase/epimerase, partial [Rhizobacter sp.]